MRTNEYREHREALDFALENGGAELSFSTHGQAVKFRQRCYQFRKAFAKGNPESPYDLLTIPDITRDPEARSIRIVKRENPVIGMRALGSPKPKLEVADDEDIEDLEIE